MPGFWSNCARCWLSQPLLGPKPRRDPCVSAREQARQRSQPTKRTEHLAASPAQCVRVSDPSIARQKRGSGPFGSRSQFENGPAEPRIRQCSTCALPSARVRRSRSNTPNPKSRCMHLHMSPMKRAVTSFGGICGVAGPPVRAPGRGVPSEKLGFRCVRRALSRECARAHANGENGHLTRWASRPAHTSDPCSAQRPTNRTQRPRGTPSGPP